MAASIQTIVTAVHAHALLSATAFPGITFAVGRKAIKENASPPRVVWVPTNGTVEATKWVGHERVVGGQSGSRDRQVRTRVQNFQVHCWGASIAQAENLMDSVLAAGWDLERGFFRAGDFEFFGQQDGTADYAVLGEKVVLQVTFLIPVRTTLADMTALTQQTHVGHFLSDINPGNPPIVAC